MGDILTRRPLIQPSSMAFSQPILRTLCSVLFFLSCVQALKFDIEAFSKGDSRGTRCIRNFVAKDTLVVVTATVDGTKGDGMILNMHIKDAVGNEYGRPKDVVGEKRMAFTSHADASFDVCFETELRRMEEMVAEIVAEMDYLRSREQKLRDTNESTNNRVKWFAFGTMGMLVALGAWQVIYLRAYFRSKHLI